MPANRYILQAQEKIAAICAALHRAGALDKADMKSLAEAAGVSYSTLKSAVQKQRFSPQLEDALATFGKFDRDHPSWIDDAVPEVERRNAHLADYRGRDTLEQFRMQLNMIWQDVSVTFRATQRSYAAIDPHMARHELSDLGQSTPAGSDMQFFLTANFEPFCHRSGIVFGFRKAAVVLDIPSPNGARATRRLGHPRQVVLGDATLAGDGMSRQLRWQLERAGGPTDILKGEYRTGDEPLVAIECHEDGTAVVTRVEVNIFDRATYAAESLDISANKQALIEQIFCKELPEAETRNGWVTLSRHETVIARYER